MTCSVLKTTTTELTGHKRLDAHLHDHQVRDLSNTFYHSPMVSLKKTHWVIPTVAQHNVHEDVGSISDLPQ